MPNGNLLARRTRNMGASAIREILKVVSRPGMISLAGGIPAPESFPMANIREITVNVLEKYGPSAFQYDLTEGFFPLREALADYLASKGIVADAEQILVSSGSQGVLDGLGKILIDPGSRVAVEAPTYLGALQAFTPYEPRYAHIDTDDQDEKPLDPVMENVRRKMMRLQLVSGGIMLLMFMAVLAAIVYKISQRESKPEAVVSGQPIVPSDAPVKATAVLPAGFAVSAVSQSNGQILFYGATAEGNRKAYLFDIAAGRIVAEIDVTGN